MSVTKPAKHGRDHCPGGEDPIPCYSISMFRASRSVTTISGITATSQNIDWDRWENGDPNIFTPRKTTGGADPIEGTDLVRSIRLLKPGRYTFTVGLHWQTGTGDIDGYALALNDDDATYGYPDQHFEGPVKTYNSRGFGTSTFTRVYPLIDLGSNVVWPDFSTGNFVPAYWTIAVIAAASRTIDLATLEIHYEGNVTFVTPGS